MNGDRILFFDANIIIDYINNDKNVVDIFDKYSALYGMLYLSVIVEIEVLSFAKLSEENVSELKSFFKNNFTLLNLDENIADITASLRRKNKIKLPDALIAATAISMNAPLLTKNIKDFKKIPELKILSI